MLSPLRWVIVTGEYPPARGGVGDYTANVAGALARAGDEVHVIAPPGIPGASQPNVRVHRLPDHFGVRSLRAMSRLLGQIPRPRVLLLQYVPHAFGHRSLNVGFCAWWALQRREHRVVMFHEVSSPIDPRSSVKQSILGCVHRPMAAGLIGSSSLLFTSTDAWRPLLSTLGADLRRTITLPIPSNLPEAVDKHEVSRARRIHGGPRHLIGSFGTFGSLVAPLLRQVILELFEQAPQAKFALIGRGAARFVETQLPLAYAAGNRVSVMEDLPADEAAATIAACDLLIQPYPDGVTTRRTSMMAGLALGRPVVTNAGTLTEPLWRPSGACVLAGTPAQLSSEALQLLQNENQRQHMGRVAGDFYRREFSLLSVVAIMRHRCAAL